LQRYTNPGKNGMIAARKNGSRKFNQGEET